MLACLLFFSLLRTVLGDSLNVTCYITGNVSLANVLNGSLTLCTPNYLECYLKDDQKFTTKSENVRCMEAGQLWYRKHYCHFVYFFRYKICETREKCYQTRFSCYREVFYLTLPSWIAIGFVFLGFVLTGCYIGCKFITTHAETYEVQKRMNNEIEMSHRNITFDEHE